MTPSAHADTVQRFGEAQHVQPCIEDANRHIADFAIVVSGVSLDKCSLKLECSREFKGQLALLGVPVVLSGFDIRGLGCSLELCTV